MDSRPPDFQALIAELTRELEHDGLPFMLIGGQAVLLHGRPRLTEDIDVTLGADPSRLPDVLAVCVRLRLTPLPADVAAFIADTFVLPARHDGSGIRVDFIFSTTEYERQAIARAVRVEMAGVRVPFATAEDLVIHKVFAGRPRDLEDARMVVERQGSALDWPYIEHWGKAFAEVPGREAMPATLIALKTRRMT